MAAAVSLPVKRCVSPGPSQFRQEEGWWGRGGEGMRGLAVRAIPGPQGPVGGGRREAQLRVAVARVLGSRALGNQAWDGLMANDSGLGGATATTSPVSATSHYKVAPIKPATCCLPRLSQATS